MPGLQVSPFVSERVEYETNVFQTRTNPKADAVSRASPGLLVEYVAGPASLSAGYRAEILTFLELPRQDTVHHLGLGQFRLQLPRLLVSVQDNFTLTSDPPNSELTGRVQSTTNVLAPETGYRLSSRLSLGANYSWTHVKFDTVDELNRDEHVIGVSGSWSFLPKASLGLNYSYGESTFSEATDRDVTRQTAGVGLRGDLTAKLSSTFRAAVEHREPQDDGPKGFTGLVLGGDWTYRPTQRTTVMLLTDRSVQESTFGTGKFFVSTTANLSLTHAILPKLSATLRLTAGENDYPTKDTVDGRTRWRQDMLWGGGSVLNYEIQRWLRVGLEYSYTRRDSNFQTFDFSDHKVATTISFQF